MIACPRRRDADSILCCTLGTRLTPFALSEDTVISFLSWRKSQREAYLYLPLLAWQAVEKMHVCRQFLAAVMGACWPQDPTDEVEWGLWRLRSTQAEARRRCGMARNGTNHALAIYLPLFLF